MKLMCTWKDGILEPVRQRGALYREPPERDIGE